MKVCRALTHMAPRTGPRTLAGPARSVPGAGGAPERRSGGGTVGTARRGWPAHYSSGRGRDGRSTGIRACDASGGWSSGAAAGACAACRPRNARRGRLRPTTDRHRGVAPRAHAAGHSARTGLRRAGTAPRPRADASRKDRGCGGGGGSARGRGLGRGREPRLQRRAGAGTFSPDPALRAASVGDRASPRRRAARGSIGMPTSPSAWRTPSHVVAARSASRPIILNVMPAASRKPSGCRARRAASSSASQAGVIVRSMVGISSARAEVAEHRMRPKGADSPGRHRFASPAHGLRASDVAAGRLM